MAKSFTLPQIEGLPGLVAMLGEPDRCLSFLQSAQDMLAAINARLGDLDTHEKVEASVASANMLMQEVQAAKQKMVERVREATVSAAKLIDEANAEAAQILEGAKAIEAQHMETLGRVDARWNGLNEIETALIVREKANAAASDELTRRLEDIVSREKELEAKVKRVAEAIEG